MTVGNVNDGDVAEKQKPPSRGTESLDVLVVIDAAVVACTGDKLNVTVRAVLFDDFSSLCAADVTGKILAGVDVTGTEITLLGVETFSGSFGISFVSLMGGFTSIILVLIASDGAFKTDVVVAVLNVTEVLVDRFADGEDDDEDTITFGSSFSLDFLSSATLLLL